MQKEIERLPKILVMLYTCTFLVFLIEIHQKHYPDLSEGVMSPSGNGFNTTNQKEYLSKDGKHPVSTDGGTWYPQACRFLKIKHRLHSSYEKSIIERTIQSIKDRTESFDDYFPCTKRKCKLQHIRNWFNLFVGCYNRDNP